MVEIKTFISIKRECSVPAGVFLWAESVIQIYNILMRSHDPEIYQNLAELKSSANPTTCDITVSFSFYSFLESNTRIHE